MHVSTTPRVLTVKDSKFLGHNLQKQSDDDELDTGKFANLI